MVKKLNSLVTLTPKTSKKKKKTKKKDPCLVCSKDLYYDTEYSKRVGLIDEDDNILGWMCPFCRSEFTIKHKLKSFGGEYEKSAGDA